MSAYKPNSIYPFLAEFEDIAKTIKQEIISVENKINDPSDNSVAMIENGNKGSTIYKNKTWNPLFALVIQGQLWRDFMKEHEFAPGIEQANGLELACALDIVESYYEQHIPKTTSLIKKLFERNREWITNIYIWRLQGDKGALPLHTNYDPHMYRCHLGILVPEGDIGLEVDGIKTQWQEGKFVIFDSMRPHRVWNNTGKARYIVSIDCYRPEPNKAEVEAVQKTLVAMRMSKNKFSYALSGGMPVLLNKITNENT